MEPERPSSIPPRRARQAAWTGLIVAVSTLIGAYAAKLLTAPAPDPTRPPMEVKPPPSQPIPEFPSGIENTPADRFVRKAAADELRDVNARLAALESIVCALKQTVRDLEERNVKQQGGKRWSDARDDFNAASTAWTLCPAVQAGDKPQQLPPLLKASDSALRR